jgi:exoribonuclease R
MENNQLNDINPFDMRLFTDDIVIPNGEVVESHIRTFNAIPGVLLLENNKTYGRTDNKKRLLYKCVPNDTTLPAFLIPYDIRIGFSKDIKNKYVVFKFEHWNQKHPQGILLEVLGNVNELNAYYEYQLYCKNIHDSISDFNKKTRQLLANKDTHGLIEKIRNNTNFSIVDRTEDYVFSIDPKGCLDMDDAFSIKQNDHGNWVISIYIANVFFWLETFDLWEYITTRVSTIYLPDRNRTMLPSILSDNLCSLFEKQLRFAFCMDIEIDNNGNIITDMKTIKITNTVIKVSKNYYYEEPALLKNKHYNNLLDIIKQHDSKIKDSHDLVEYLMIYMNTKCGKIMAREKVGIFRSVVITNGNLEMLNDDHLPNIVKYWNNVSGEYVLYSEQAYLKHDLMGIDTYSHISSPIRRLVDLLNQSIFCIHFGLVYNISSSATHLLNYWLNHIELINNRMRLIKKVQNNCEIMRLCNENQDVMENLHEGIILDKIQIDGYFKPTKNVNPQGGLNSSWSITTEEINPSHFGADLNLQWFKYTVYLLDIKIQSNIKLSVDLELYSTHSFNMYYFGDEYDLKRKIKLQIVL